MAPPGRLREREQGDGIKPCNWLMCVCPSSFLCNSIRHLFDLTLSGNYIITLCSGQCWPSRVLALILFHFLLKWIFLCSQRLRKVQDSNTAIISGSSGRLLYCELAAHEGLRFLLSPFLIKIMYSQSLHWSEINREENKIKNHALPFQWYCVQIIITVSVRKK